MRKHLGHAHIPQRFAGAVNACCREYLNPYVNFQRPCFFATSIVDAQGKIRKRYPLEETGTPHEKLKSLPHAQNFLKAGVGFKQLDALAASIGDNEAAKRLNEARTQRFQSVHRDPTVRPDHHLSPLTVQAHT